MDFYVKQLSQVVGGTITTVAVDDENEFFGLSIAMPDGSRKVLWFLSDDEGNGPGSFDIEDDGHE